MYKGEVLAVGTRGGLEDTVYTGHVVVTDNKGNIVYAVGDPDKLVFARSSAKLIQAIPVFESGAVDYYKITDREIALICSSHSGEDYHVEAVKELLGKADLDESNLLCGTHYPMYKPLADEMFRQGIVPTPFQEMCSGKHAGMLLASKLHGDSLSDYYLPEHPHQQRILKTISELCDYPAEDIVIGLDGCGVPVHALPIKNFAMAFARFADPSVLCEERKKIVKRIVGAIQSYPLYVSGHDRLDSKVDALGRNVFSKSGADGYYGLGIIDKGYGIAIKVDCGSGPVRDAVVVEVLRQLDAINEEDLKTFENEISMNVYNHRNEVVGTTRCCFRLQ